MTMLQTKDPFAPPDPMEAAYDKYLKNAGGIAPVKPVDPMEAAFDQYASPDTPPESPEQRATQNFEQRRSSPIDPADVKEQRTWLNATVESVRRVGQQMVSTPKPSLNETLANYPANYVNEEIVQNLAIEYQLRAEPMPADTPEDTLRFRVATTPLNDASVLMLVQRRAELRTPRFGTPESWTHPAEKAAAIKEMKPPEQFPFRRREPRPPTLPAGAITPKPHPDVEAAIKEAKAKGDISAAEAWERKSMHDALVPFNKSIRDYGMNWLAELSEQVIEETVARKERLEKELNTLRWEQKHEQWLLPKEEKDALQKEMASKREALDEELANIRTAPSFTWTRDRLHKENVARLREYTTYGAVMEGVLELPHYIGEFALTGGFGAMVAAGTKGGMAVKFLTGALAQSAAMAPTWLAEVTKRLVSRGGYIASDGHAMYDDPKMSGLDSFLHGTVSHVIQTASERLGVHIDKVVKIGWTKLAGRLAKYPKLKRQVEFLGRVAKRISPDPDGVMSLGGIQSAVSEFNEEQVAAFLLGAFGIDITGTPSEIDNERARQMLRGLFPEAKDAFTTIAVLSVPQLVGLAGKVAIKPVHYARATDWGRFTKQEAAFLDAAGIPNNVRKSMSADDLSAAVLDTVTETLRALNAIEMSSKQREQAEETEDAVQAEIEEEALGEDVESVRDIPMPGDEALAEVEEDAVEYSEEEYAADYEAMQKEEEAATPEDVGEPVEEEYPPLVEPEGEAEEKPTAEAVTERVTAAQKVSAEGRHITLKDKIRERQERNLAKIQSTKAKAKPAEQPPAEDIADTGKKVTNRQRVAKQLAKEFPTGERGVDTQLAVHDAFAAQLVEDGKIEDADEYYAELWIGPPKAKPQAVDMFGRPVAPKPTGEQKELGVEEAKTEAMRRPAKPELVKAIAKMISTGQKPKTAKDAYMDILATYKGESNELFNDPTKPMPEIEQAFIEATEGGLLFQGERGSYQRVGGVSVIRALKSADESTIAHELAHYLRRMASRYYPEDSAVLERHFKVKDGKWTLAKEEAFAGSWLRYLRTGKAPTRALQSVFDQFKAWLTRIYKSLKAIVQPDGGKKPHPLALSSLGITQKQWNITTAIFDKWLGEKITLETILGQHQEDADRKAAKRQANILAGEIVAYGQDHFDFHTPEDMLAPDESGMAGEQYAASDTGFTGLFAGEIPGEVARILNEMNFADRMRYGKFIKAFSPHGAAADYLAEVGSDVWWAQAHMVALSKSGKDAFYIDHASKVAIDLQDYDMSAAVAMYNDLLASETPFDSVEDERSNRATELSQAYAKQSAIPQGEAASELRGERNTLLDEKDDLVARLEREDDADALERIAEIDVRVAEITDLLDDDPGDAPDIPTMTMFQQALDPAEYEANKQATIVANAMLRVYSRKETRRDMRKMFRQGQLDVHYTIKDLVDLARKSMPVEERGRVIAALNQVKSSKSGIKGFIKRVNAVLKKYHHRKAIADFKKAIPSPTEIRKLAPTYRNLVAAIAKTYDPRRMSPRTQKALARMARFMEEPGNQHGIPEAAWGRMQAQIARLERVPLASLDADAINDLTRLVQSYVAQSKLLTELRRQQRDRANSSILERIVADLTSHKRTMIGGLETIMEQKGRGVTYRSKQKAAYVAAVLMRFANRGSMDGYNLADHMGITMRQVAYDEPHEGMRNHAKIITTQQVLFHAALEKLGFKWGSKQLIKLTTDMVDVTIPSAEQSLQMTTAELVTLMGHLDQPYTREQISDNKVAFVIESQRTTGADVIVQLEDFDALIQQHPEAYKLMLTIQHNMSLLTDDLNATSVEWEGYEKFLEESYWTVATVAERREGAEVPTQQRWAMTLPENIGMMKERTGRSNVILLEDCFTAWASHLHNAATYISMTGHIKRLQVVMGSASVKMAARQTYGPTMLNRFIQGRLESMTLLSSPPTTGFDTVGKKASHLLVVSALTVNPSPSLKQPAGLAMLLTELDDNPLEAWRMLVVDGIPHMFSSVWWKRAMKYAHLLNERFEGHASALVAPESGEGSSLLGRKSWIEKGMLGLTYADAANGVAAFAALTKKMERTTDLTGEALWAAAGKKTDLAISLTQNATNVLDYSNWAMDARKSAVVRFFLLFKSEPNKKYNVAIRALTKYARSKKTVADKATLLHNLLLVQLLSATWVWGIRIGLAKAAFAAFGGRAINPDDETMEGWLWGLIEEISGLVYGGDDAVYAVKRTIRGWGDTSVPPKLRGVMPTQRVEELFRGVWKLTQALSTPSGEVFQSGPRKGKRKVKAYAWEGAFEVLRGGGAFFGLPLFPLRMAKKAFGVEPPRRKRPAKKAKREFAWKY